MQEMGAHPQEQCQWTQGMSCREDDGKGRHNYLATLPGLLATTTVQNRMSNTLSLVTNLKMVNFRAPV